MKLHQEVLILFALTVLAAAGTHFLHPRAPAWHEADESLRDDEITLQHISQTWKNDVLWIDARPSALFGKAHIPGAININEQELESQLIDNIAVLQDNRKPVVIYCDSSACQASRKIRDYLAQRLPTEEFYVLRGGWSAWFQEQQR
ncbi:MAG: rhodanese-like domain-containing protein [Verrucomicrobia bacterium]|nr:rhodanese-like domain-containing protein [Verrucomicrobiota bacterium]